MRVGVRLQSTSILLGLSLRDMDDSSSEFEEVLSLSHELERVCVDPRFPLPRRTDWIMRFSESLELSSDFYRYVLTSITMNYNNGTRGLIKLRIAIFVVYV